MAAELPSILIVDDDRHLATQVAWALKDGYRLRMAHSRPEALAALEAERPDILLLDLCLPPDNVPDEGFRILAAARRNGPETLVVVMSAIDDRDPALRAIAEGAYDFFAKPADLDTLRIVVARAVERQALERENRRLRGELEARDSIEGMIGISPPMKKIFDAIRRVADSAVTVFIQGESGTGKELVARAIHFSGNRRQAPFVPVHCAALPESLLEAELFGHERGAFTGAVGARIGRFEAADGGTLFLDEISCLNQAAQVKLLRVLEDHCIERLGSNRSRSVDIRLIAASNEDLREKVRQGEFREDLFFRISVFPIHLPPLRERSGDVPLLAEHFLHQVRAERNRPARRFSPEAMAILCANEWTGNVRELRNAVETVALMTDGETIESADLPVHLARPSSAAHAPLPGRGPAVRFRAAVEEFEKRTVLDAIAQSGGSKAEAARRLGLDPGQMKYLVKKYGA